MEATPREGEATKGGECRRISPVPLLSQDKRMVLPMRKSGDEYLYI